MHGQSNNKGIKMFSVTEFGFDRIILCGRFVGIFFTYNLGAQSDGRYPWRPWRNGQRWSEWSVRNPHPPCPDGRPRGRPGKSGRLDRAQWCGPRVSGRIPSTWSEKIDMGPFMIHEDTRGVGGTWLLSTSFVFKPRPHDKMSRLKCYPNFVIFRAHVDYGWPLSSLLNFQQSSYSTQFLHVQVHCLVVPWFWLLIRWLGPTFVLLIRPHGRLTRSRSDELATSLSRLRCWKRITQLLFFENQTLNPQPFFCQLSTGTYQNTLEHTKAY